MGVGVFWAVEGVGGWGVRDDGDDGVWLGEGEGEGGRGKMELMRMARRRRSIASEGQVFHAQANIERERKDKASHYREGK